MRNPTQAYFGTPEEMQEAVAKMREEGHLVKVQRMPDRPAGIWILRHGERMYQLRVTKKQSAA